MVPPQCQHSCQQLHYNLICPVCCWFFYIFVFFSLFACIKVQWAKTLTGWKDSRDFTTGHWNNAVKFCISIIWCHQWELKSPDAPSAKLLQLSGTTYRSIHAPLLHTNYSDLRQRNIFTNWLSWTDHVTVSAPTIRFFPPTAYGALSNTYNNNNNALSNAI